ncbi:tRNA (guanosine(46)-N7)-methyltransferase TrmB [bacterium]|nr:tRNA (guanosine(46)-N7)-methyltransferase TrmB [bacterium]
MNPAAPENLIYTPESYVDRLDYRAMFAKDQPLEVEIGCGDGGFLGQFAARHPERNFIGVERLKGRLGKLDRRGRREGLTNIRLMRIEATYFVQYLLQPRSVEAMHIYFPDPWPKKRHHKNRLIQPPFLDVLTGALRKEGTVFLRTDNIPYFEQMVEVFGADSRFEAIETPDELKVVVTDFEREFNAQGIPTNYAAYRLTA